MVVKLLDLRYTLLTRKNTGKSVDLPAELPVSVFFPVK